MNGGQIIAQILLEYGVNHLFTLSGGHIAPIYVEAEKAGITIIDVRHEVSSVFAADALARISGNIGVAVVTAGPGVTNTITALKNAQLAQSPVLLIGGAAATLLKGRGALQDIDQMALVKPHVKWTKRVSRIKNLSPIMHKAVQVAMSGVPGPVFIECPVDLLYEESIIRDLYKQNMSKSNSATARIRNWYISRHVNRLFSGVNPSDISGLKNVARNETISTSRVSTAIMLIAEAKKPVLILSSGAMKDPVLVPALVESLNKLAIPVYLSGMARGLLGRSCEIQYFHKRSTALKESDCIILAGVPVDFRLAYGAYFKRTKTKITVNLSKSELTKNLTPDLSIHGNPAQFLIQLAESKDATPKKWAMWHDTLKSRDLEREKEIANLSGEKTNDINPVALLRQLENLLPENSVIVVDGGDFAATAAYTLRPRKALKWLDPGVFGTLGVGGGFALGATLYYPDHYVWIIYGDGSAAYSLSEFDTFKKFGLKVCGIIGNNGSWEQIAREQIPLLKRDTASTLPQSDYQMIAQAFGSRGERVDNMNSLSNAVDTAIDSMDKNIPYLINAIIGSTGFREGSISM